jgi:hypothetical protein
MNSETKTQSMQDTSNSFFGVGIGGLDPSHYFTSLLWIEFICHLRFYGGNGTIRGWSRRLSLQAAGAPHYQSVLRFRFYFRRI